MQIARNIKVCVSLRTRSLRIWYLVHKWTSLICTAFLLMLCLTGLPLIFHDEIEVMTGEAPAMQGAGSSGDGPDLQPLDVMLGKALAARPGEVPVFMAFDNETPILTVTTAPAPDSPGRAMTIQLFNRVTGEPAGQVVEEGVMHLLLQLHTDMFLGLPGMLCTISASREKGHENADTPVHVYGPQGLADFIK